MRRYRLGNHAQYDLKVHLVWCPKYRKREFPHLKKQYWDRHLWARGYLAIPAGTITAEMINEHINEQEGEPVHEEDSRFQIDPS